MHHTFAPGRRHSAQVSRGRWPFINANGHNLGPAIPFEGKRFQSNPILPAPSQDPQVSYFEGRYYYCESTAEGIFLRVAEDFLSFAHAPRICVWKPLRRGPCSKNIWAPELHFIDGRPYIYFAADDGKNANHRMWAIEGRSADPLGDYRSPTRFETSGWAIDGTVLENSGERFFVWSGWAGRQDGQQNLYMARMASPTKLASERVLLTMPTEDWERHAMPICEGPQILQRGGRTFIVYSASASWTSEYCLGLMVHEGGALDDPRGWRKVGRIFSSNEHAVGVGHCGFLQTPEGEDWLFYHAKQSRKNGWGDREVRAQLHAWTEDGLPHLGEPVPRDRAVWRPSRVSGASLRLAS